MISVWLLGIEIKSRNRIFTAQIKNELDINLLTLMIMIGIQNIFSRRIESL